MSAAHSSKAVTYFRMSTLRQEDSIERQRSQVLPYAAKRGYTIVREYLDEGISGGEILRRKEFQRMLRDAQTGAFQAILCDDKDRFGRFDSIDLGEIVAPLRRKGVWVDTVAQGKIDWESFSGRITDAVLQEAKNLEQEAISRRVLSMQLLAAQSAKYTGGPALYGFRLEPDPLRVMIYVPDGHKGEVVQFIFRRYDEGASTRQIAAELFARGVRSPRGGPRWAPNTLWSLLQNRKYCGDWSWGAHATGKRHRHGGKGVLAVTPREGPRCVRVPPADWVVIPEAHEALIDRDLFARVQNRLLGNRERRTPHTGGGLFVLSKLLVCGHCGSYLLGATLRGRRVYSCGGYLAHGKSYCNLHTTREDVLVRLLLAKLQDSFLDPANLARLRQEIAAQEQAARDPNRLAQLRRQVEQLERKICQGGERLLEIDPAHLPEATAALGRWKAQLQSVQEELRKSETAKPAEGLEKVIAAAEAALWSLHGALEAEDYPLLRQLLRETFTKVELFWEHRPTAKTTRSTLSHGTLTLTNQETINLSSSAGRCEQDGSLTIAFTAADLSDVR